ncbi:hypothetical protein BDD12DRAFT_874832 [Trichophaea hybrida]|nr:hypothetical protein BDD12DRAFT_874832 [Trichophaea hybrida]
MCCIPWCYTFCCEPRRFYRLYKRRNQRGSSSSGDRSDNSTRSSENARIYTEKRPRERGEREQRRKRRSQSTGREKRRKSPSSSTEGHHHHHHSTPHIIVTPVVIPPPPPATSFEQWNPDPPVEEFEIFARQQSPSPPTPAAISLPTPPPTVPTSPQQPISHTPPQRTNIPPPHPSAHPLAPPSNPHRRPNPFPTTPLLFTTDLAQYLLPPSTIGPVDEDDQPQPCVDVAIYSSPASHRRERSVSRVRPRSSYGGPRDSHHSVYDDGDVPPIPGAADRDKSVYIDQTRKRRSQPEPLARGGTVFGGDTGRGRQQGDTGRGRQQGDVTRGGRKRGQSVDVYRGPPTAADFTRGQSMDLPRGGGQPVDFFSSRQSVDSTRGKAADFTRVDVSRRHHHHQVDAPPQRVQQQPIDVHPGNLVDYARDNDTQQQEQQTELDFDDFVSNVESLAREAVKEDDLQPKRCFVRERREQEEREREEQERLRGSGETHDGRRTLGDERKQKSSTKPQDFKRLPEYDFQDYQPRQQPKVSFAYDENDPIPRTYKELREHLSSHIVNQGLESIIPPDSPDPLLIARRAEAEADRICASLGISSHATPDLTKVGLYDIIVFCDDSGSMSMDNRFDDQKSIVQRISRIAQTYNKSGISLRFINFRNDDGYNNLSHGEINSAVSKVSPNGTTQLGTKLLEKVMFPFVIDPARKMELKKPVLISIITDGEPTEEDIDTFKWSILACKNQLRKLVSTQGMAYGKSAVTFQISRIGDSPESKRFLERLRNDPEVGDLIFCSDETLDKAVRDAGGESGRLNTWLTQLLAGAVTV